MRNYEGVFIINPDLVGDAAKGIVTQVQGNDIKEGMKVIAGSLQAGSTTSTAQQTTSSPFGGSSQQQRGGGRPGGF